MLNIYMNFIGHFETTKYQGKQDGVKNTQKSEDQKIMCIVLQLSE